MTMTPHDLIHYRLYTQQISNHQFSKPEQVVSWLGAVQAQDYLNSLWAIGLRLPHCTESEVEKAISDKSIVRTWPMRGTLHFVNPEEVRWMLKLLTPRVMARASGRHRDLGLTKSIFLKSARLISKALEKSKSLTRNELYAILEKGNIKTTDSSGLHIIVQLAQEGLICCGPRKSKQPTFVSLDDWVPAFKELKKEEALARLAEGYFRSHGPATLQDFIWWSGLTTAEAKTALESVKSKFTNATVGDKVHWFIPSSIPKGLTKTTFLLPNYDEYVVGYKDRTHLQVAALDEKFSRNNMVFNNTIVTGGQLAGQWNRVLQKNSVEMKYTLFLTHPKVISSLKKAGQNYSRFLKLPLK
jgi:hypothetical protein